MLLTARRLKRETKLPCSQYEMTTINGSPRVMTPTNETKLGWLPTCAMIKLSCSNSIAAASGELKDEFWVYLTTFAAVKCEGAPPQGLSSNMDFQTCPNSPLPITSTIVKCDRLSSRGVDARLLAFSSVSIKPFAT